MWGMVEIKKIVAEALEDVFEKIRYCYGSEWKWLGLSRHVNLSSFREPITKGSSDGLRNA